MGNNLWMTLRVKRPLKATQGGGTGDLMTQGTPAIVIASSSADIASRTLAEALIRNQGFESTGISLLGRLVYQKNSLFLATFEGPIIRPPDLDSFFNPQAYVFLSRHVAESGIPSLTAHTTGNFSQDASAGGVGRELGRADPGLLKDYLIALSKRRDRMPSYEITLEGTHHGPTSLSKPVMFAELGSTEAQWSDRKAAGAIAESLVEALTQRGIWDKVAVGFGGTHYPRKFSRAVTEGEFAVSFIAPRHSLEYVDEAMVGQMIQKTLGPVRYALLDWKGLGPHKDKIVKAVTKFGLEIVRL